MKRRRFNQLLAFGAGTLPVLAGAGKTQGEVPDAKAPGENNPPENQPVNVEEYIELAKANLPQATFDYITSGSCDQITVRENIEAFRRIKVYPPLLHGVGKAELSTTVLGQKIALPVLLAPVAAQRMYHREGGLAAARAAAKAGTIYGMSSNVGNSVEEIAAVSTGPKWFQLYMPKDRTIARKLVRRVDRAGFKAIILTVDLGEWKDSDRRNNFSLPKDMLLKHLRDIGFTQLNDSMSYEEILAFNADAWDLSLSWDVFKWLRGVTDLPILLKGVLRTADAQRAAELGLDGLIVSNHGGRRLDGMPASIDSLKDIVEAVGGEMEVLMDGGVRRGTDVLKALAYGAKAVLIGRPYAWALGADGERGVSHVLKLLRDELENAMVSTGCPSIGDIESSLVS